MTGTLVLDLLLGDVHSLKGKRAVVRPVVAALRRLDVAAAETGHVELHRRAEIGVAAVGSSHGHVREVLEACERLVAAARRWSCCPPARGCSTTTTSRCEGKGRDVADEARARRMAGRIKQIVARGLETQVKDPRLGMVTVTDVQVTGDLHDATVFYTVLGDETAQADSAAALESARGRLRSEVGRQTGVKFTPTLAFVLDAVPDVARQVDELLARATQADAEVARLREGATFAGDPDPYKVPRVADDDEE